MPLQDKVFSPFDEIQIKELRRKRFKEIEIGRISRQVIVYCVFFGFYMLYVIQTLIHKHLNIKIT